MSYYYDVDLSTDLEKGSIDEPCQVFYQIKIGSKWDPTGGNPKAKVLAWTAPKKIRIQSEFDNFILLPDPKFRARMVIEGPNRKSYDVLSLKMA